MTADFADTADSKNDWCPNIPCKSVSSALNHQDCKKGYTLSDFHSHLRRAINRIGAAVFLSLVTSVAQADSGFNNFITRDGTQLMDGDRPFRFLSFNIPNLSYTEDNLQFDKTSGFRLPTQFEI